ncbi:MAG: hypothetical protein KAT70_09290 [Thermoplasmata archaeon]|nr:hypothetical protein [Thermoplasmata archaeon]
MPTISYQSDGHQWQLFGDGTDLTLSLEGQHSILMRRVWITSWGLQIDRDMIEISNSLGGFTEFMPGLKSAELNLTIRPTQVEMVEDNGLWVPQKSIDRLSIRDLFGIINEKIDKR